MPKLRCPVCAEPLLRREHSLVCERGHSFDLARQGYVNLLLSSRSAARCHGDDRQMLRSRTDFLEKGYYSLLRDALCEEAVCALEGRAKVDFLDIGCGEGYYTTAVVEALEREGKTVSALGLDISKEAVLSLARRKKGIDCVVASAARLPVSDASCDLVTSLFAPVEEKEVYRVLRAGGIYLYVAPGERHLMGLKEKLYEKPYPNPCPEYAPPGFSECLRRELTARIFLPCAEDVGNLFAMTPYAHKTARKDSEKLLSLSELETEISFCLFVFRKLAPSEG